MLAILAALCFLLCAALVWLAALGIPAILGILALGLALLALHLVVPVTLPAFHRG